MFDHVKDMTSEAEQQHKVPPEPMNSLTSRKFGTMFPTSVWPIPQAIKTVIPQVKDSIEEKASSVLHKHGGERNLQYEFQIKSNMRGETNNM